MDSSFTTSPSSAQASATAQQPPSSSSASSQSPPHEQTAQQPAQQQQQQPPQPSQQPSSQPSSTQTPQSAQQQQPAQPAPPTSLPTPRQQPPVFEFTKRKKWADLLLHELTGTIIFVLSPTLKVLYCGPAITELLGWHEDEFTDAGLENFIHEEDLQPFVNHFNASIASRSELCTFARLEGKTPDARWPLFEFRGHPHYTSSPLGGNVNECKCFFAMARPYPSRSTAMLDSFLELKMENERLRQRLVELRPQGSNGVPAAAPFGTSTSSVRDATADPPTATAALPPTYHPTIPGLPLHASVHAAHGAHGHPYFPMSSSRTALDDVLGLPMSMGMHHSDRNGGYADPEPDEGRRKKARRSHAGDQQYVCVSCGRTDSPEWRKGPQGPKTLCNACGLRWAKRNSMKRRADDPSGPNPTPADLTS